MEKNYSVTNTMFSRKLNIRTDLAKDEVIKRVGMILGVEAAFTPIGEISDNHFRIRRKWGLLENVFKIIPIIEGEILEQQNGSNIKIVIGPDRIQRIFLILILSIIGLANLYFFTYFFYSLMQGRFYSDALILFSVSIIAILFSRFIFHLEASTAETTMRGLLR